MTFKRRDQWALIRALYQNPLRMYVLCNEWNTLQTLEGLAYPPGRENTAGLIHHIGEARRYEGKFTDELDSPGAWEQVRRWEATHQ